MDTLKTFIPVFFLTLLSNPLYSEEFKYHCDVVNHKNFSLVFDVNLPKNTIIHRYTIFKDTNKIRKVDQNLDIFLWDEENESVWTIQYKDPPLSVPSLTTVLFNFKHQTLIVQSIKNDTTIERSLSEDTIIQGDLYKCFSLR
jgi:hypothetical protein